MRNSLRILLLKTLALFNILIITAGCASSNTTAAIGYQLPFAPILFTIDTNGNISVSVDTTIDFPFGEVVFSVTSSSQLTTDDNSIILIIKLNQNGKSTERDYQINNQHEAVTIDAVGGEQKTTVSLGQVIIDDHNSNIKSIEVTDVRWGKTILNDPLSDNSKGYIWEEGQRDGICKFSGGAYHSIAPPGVYHSCLSQSKSTDYSDFAFEVEMRIISGNYGGIVFRGNRANMHLYYFDIDKLGNWEFGWCEAGDCSNQLQTGKIRPLSNTNLIAVTAQGDTFDLYMNEQQVDGEYEPESTYTQGQIGILAKDGSEAEFTNARVWSLTS